MFKKMDLLSGRKKGMQGGTDWLLGEILNHFNDFFHHLITDRQFSKANYLLRALSSCGNESLNHPSSRAKDMIMSTYRKMLNDSLEIDNTDYEKLSRGMKPFIKFCSVLKNKDYYFPE